MQNIHDSLIKTLCYSDIFDYPLTFEEIWRYYIGNLPVSRSLLKSRIKHPLIYKKGKYYFLKGREKIIQDREKKQKVAERKLDKAGKICRLLSYMTGIKLIGISGSLSMKNSSDNDDIDLFIITEKNSLWLTRFLTSLLLVLMGEKRDRFGILVKDKICLNMFISQNCLTIQEKDRNLFTAHEIIQMKTIINKEYTYQRFILSNLWILEYMPNCLSMKDINASQLKDNCSEKSLRNSFLTVINNIFFHFQFMYMKKHMTSEVVEKGLAKFHPQNSKDKILNAYNSRIVLYNKKIHYFKKPKNEVFEAIYSRTLTY